MNTLPALSLTQDQANRLHGYLQTYRHYALTQIMPSAERNNTQRLLQALQGKLIGEMDRQEIVFCFVLTGEEVRALKTMVVGLLTFFAHESANPQRDAALVDLAALKGTLEKLYQQREYTRR
jgi:hypothetical protein